MADDVEPHPMEEHVLALAHRLHELGIIDEVPDDARVVRETVYRHVPDQESVEK